MMTPNLITKLIRFYEQQKADKKSFANMKTTTAQLEKNIHEAISAKTYGLQEKNETISEDIRAAYVTIFKERVVKGSLVPSNSSRYSPGGTYAFFGMTHFDNHIRLMLSATHADISIYQPFALPLDLDVFQKKTRGGQITTARDFLESGSITRFDFDERFEYHNGGKLNIDISYVLDAMYNSGSINLNQEKLGSLPGWKKFSHNGQEILHTNVWCGWVSYANKIVLDPDITYRES